MPEYVNPSISAAVQKASYDFYAREQPGLISSWNEMLDRGLSERDVARLIRYAIKNQGQPLWKSAPLECALAHLVAIRKERHANTV